MAGPERRRRLFAGGDRVGRGVWEGVVQEGGLVEKNRVVEITKVLKRRSADGLGWSENGLVC